MKKAVIPLILLLGSMSDAWPQSMPFTYQGRLNNNAFPAQGIYDFRFTVFDALSGGSALGTTMAVSGVTVSNGMFTVSLDPGPGVFNGSPRWLDLAVRPTGSTTFTPLSPRQPITAVPYAVFALNAGPPPNNFARGTYPTIGGGFQNTTDGHAPTVAGGENNTAVGNHPTIAGGKANVASGTVSTVGGGSANQSQGTGGTIGGGEYNVSGAHAFVGGGWVNRADAYATTVGGGQFNIANAPMSTIGGGDDNDAQGDASTVGGGRLNASQGLLSTVAGGFQNQAFGPYSAVPGGSRNVANGPFSFAAGHRAKAIHPGSFVWADSTDADFDSTTAEQFSIRASGGVRLETGGAGLTVDGQSAIYSAGNGLQLNSGQFSLRPGTSLTNDNVQGFGFQALAPPGVWGNPIALWGVAGDSANVTPGLATAVFGDGGNAGVGVQGFSRGTGGSHAGVIGTGNAATTGVLGTSATGTGVKGVSSSGNGVQGNSSISGASGVYGENFANGGYGVAGRSGGTGTAVYGDNPNGSGWAGYFNGNVRVVGTINPPSDRNLKRDFTSIDSRAVLDKVASLPLHTWSYTNSPSVRHLGPVAQDFHAAFNLGSDDTSIATVDADGVALAAIQGLNQKLEEQLKEREARIEALERTVAGLKQLVERLAIKSEPQP